MRAFKHLHVRTDVSRGELQHRAARGGVLDDQSQEPVKPGQKVSPASVAAYPEASLYASNVFRTIFLDFENADWEKELTAFYHSDVDVPARLTVDCKTYPDVGVRFRGNTSYFMVGEGRKKSFNLSLDFLHDGQNVGGYRTLNLLNSHEDRSILRLLAGLKKMLNACRVLIILLKCSEAIKIP